MGTAVLTDDLETQMMQVQSKRVAGLEQQVKEQIELIAASRNAI